jgi:hypothetical protein
MMCVGVRLLLKYVVSETDNIRPSVEDFGPSRWSLDPTCWYF